MLWQPLHQARVPLLSSDLHWLQAGMKKLEEEEEMLHTMRQVLLFYTLAPCLTFTHTHTLLEGCFRGNSGFTMLPKEML